MKSIDLIAVHDSFLEMKVIIQLSGLGCQSEATDREQKPVQLLNSPIDRSMASHEAKRGKRKSPWAHGLFEGDLQG
ncbi:hypothetical protein DOZ80_14990 [Pseudomonas fluorescens]|uniref:Uncharacterized protein n=1 Tax=Pseudomonas fluorescens TaxID=294 RepID=A0A327N2D7_PSEFL|nr:hypothetical protein DOZ80_14990 [Pseudomonas fluorescens]